MKKMVALTLALLMAASLFLSGCSVRKDTSDSENSGSSNGSGSGDLSLIHISEPTRH